MLTLQANLKTSYVAKTTIEKLKIHPDDERTLLVDYFQHKYDRLCQCPKGMKWTLTTEKWITGLYDKAVAVDKACGKCGKETNYYGHCNTNRCHMGSEN